jgi:Tol biopolymer transport system component
LTTVSHNASPVWTTDGKRVVFSSRRAGPDNLYWKPADGSGEAESLSTQQNIQVPNSWSPDGSVLAYTVVPEQGSAAGRDIWLLPREGEPSPLIATSSDEFGAAFSPDGRWVAYVSNETGRTEVYVQPYPGPGAKHPISTGGGMEPAWSADGRELFYRSPAGDQMFVVAVVSEPGFSASKPETLFEGRYTASTAGSSYDVSRDGRRFLMVREEQGAALTELRVVLNWFEELKRLVPKEN